MIQSADPSFAPCLLPTDGAVEAPPTAGSDSLKVTDLPLAPGQFRRLAAGVQWPIEARRWPAGRPSGGRSGARRRRKDGVQPSEAV